MNTIVSLNGEWDLLWDVDDIGIQNRWYATNPSGGETVQVPHVWERVFEKKLFATDTAFYFKHFRIDPENSAKHVLLRFSRVSIHATVWVNGKFMGTHFGETTSFELDITKAVKLEDDNVICVRVASMGASNSRIDFGRDSEEEADDRYIHPYEAPISLPWQQYPFGGIFGDVSLMIGNSAFITGIQLEPDMDQERVSVEAYFNNPRGFQAKLRILMRNPAGDVAEMYKDLKLEKENGSIRFTLSIKDWKKEKFVWTPEHPNLFAIELQLESIKAKKGEPERSVSIMKQFGFRKFDCINGDFYLNDSILKIQGVNYTQHWSKGGLWTDNNKDLKKDLEAVKAAGFNAIRTGGAPLTDEALNICDEIGLLVFQELPIYTMRSSKRGLEMVYELIKESIMEQKHHPSIVTWVLGAENGSMMLENGTKLLKEVDNYDISRPIISNLNCVYLDNEEALKKDTGKLMGVTNDRTIKYSSHRLHLRMNPNANLSDFLSHYCSRDNLDEVMVPDTTLGDSNFQDEYEKFVMDVSGKILVTLKNHALLPEKPTDVDGARGTKNSKSVKTAFKQIDSFVKSDISVWPNFESFRTDANSIALKSKVDQITSLQSNPLISGYMLDQWADFGTDFCGLNDENRKSKKLTDFEKLITKPTRLLVSSLEHTVATKSEVAFQLTLLNNARLKDVAVAMEILDAKGKVVASDKQDLEGTTSLTQLGVFSLETPKNAGDYTMKFTLTSGSETVDVVEESLRVIDHEDIQDVLSNVSFLDNCEGTSDVLAALRGSEQLIFTANLSSWNDEVISQIVEVTKNGGKTLLLSDLTKEDIEFFNASHHFDWELQSHFTTGASSLSLHYLPKDSALKTTFGEDVLDEKAAAVLPGVSLNELEGATVLARSVSLVDEEIRTGVDLQILPFGKGKIILNQFNIFEGLETNALADALFKKIVELA